MDILQKFSNFQQGSRFKPSYTSEALYLKYVNERVNKQKQVNEYVNKKQIVGT
jgi:hypothetical protein